LTSDSSLVQSTARTEAEPATDVIRIAGRRRGSLARDRRDRTDL
jgi:hypothetical protein